MKYHILKSHKTFEGETFFAEHSSEITKTQMKFSYFMPQSKKPETAIIWLSGLTCNEENFITKAGAQKYLNERNCMIICPDTSPRGLDLPGEHESYDFGSGAGFYVNANTDGYRDHYRMYDYIVKEVYSLAQSFDVSQISLTGHSMGGHGALVIGLSEAELFHRISAFSPIVNPTKCSWGNKALSGYLGENEEEWKKYDACELILSGRKRNEILVDQGLADEFLEGGQLQTSHFEDACREMNQPLRIKYREGYDHSYYYISSFIEEHIDFLVS